MKLLSGKLQPLYCLLGEDTYQKLQILKELKEELFKDGDGALNYEYLLGDETNAAGILDAARTAAWGLFAAAGRGRRLVVVDRAEKISPADWKRMKDYFVAPDPGACLVFLVNRKEREWSFRSLFPKKCLFSCAPLKGKKLEERIRREASERRLRIGDEPLQALVRLAGSDFGSLVGGLDKLVLYKSGGGEVSADEVAAVIGVGREGTIFDLTGLIVTRRTSAALLLLNRLLDEGEHPLKILSLVGGTFRKLWLGVEAREKTKNSRTICEEAGVRFYQPQFLRAVEKLAPADIGYCYRRLVETDDALKGGEKNLRLALERLVIDLSGARSGLPVSGGEALTSS
ncbi:MAG: DNA polymerase III subunit delta [PVC group bacterium]